MRICFLGTGGSWPTKRRNPVSIAVTSGRTNLLLDCGEGTQRQMLFSPVSPMKIDAILITHLHGDHFLGLPGLMQSMSLNDRSGRLEIYGPEGIVQSFRNAMTMCHYNPRFETEVHSVEPGDAFRIGELNVFVGKADHFIPAIAFRIFQDERPGRFNRKAAFSLGIPEGPLWSRLQRGEDVIIGEGDSRKVIKPEMVLGPPRPGRSLAYTGDTGFSENIISLAKGSDVLIHEATFAEELSDLAYEYKHSTAKEAAATALKADVGRLFLVHSSPRYAKEGAETVLLEEARTVFKESYIPEDLECFNISR